MQNLLVFLRIAFAIGVPFLAMEAGQYLTPWVKVPLAVFSGLIVYLSGTWLSDSDLYKEKFLNPFGRFFLVAVAILTLLIMSRPIFYAFHGHPFAESMGAGRIWFSAFLIFFLCFMLSMYLLYLLFSDENMSAEDLCSDMVGDYWWAILLTIGMAFLP